MFHRTDSAVCTARDEGDAHPGDNAALDMHPVHDRKRRRPVRVVQIEPGERVGTVDPLLHEVNGPSCSAGNRASTLTSSGMTFAPSYWMRNVILYVVCNHGQARRVSPM